MKRKFLLKAIFLLGSILAALFSLLSFNSNFIHCLAELLHLEPALAPKLNKYITNYRLLYLSLSLLVSLFYLSFFLVGWQALVKRFYSSFNSKIESLNYSLWFVVEAKVIKSRPIKYVKGRPEIVLFLGLSVATLFSLFLAWFDFEVIIGKFIYDDMYCYLKVARNIVSGNGPTFDGINPTNGFHPLWMAVSIVLQFLFYPYPSLIVHLTLTIGAVAHVLLAYFIYKTVALMGYRWMGIGAALFWGLNYNIISIGLSGLETPLYGMFLVFLFYTYLKYRKELNFVRSLVIGTLLGITALARFDGILFGFFLAGDYLLVNRNKFGLALRNLLVIACVVAFLFLPWGIWSYSRFGYFFPVTFQSKSPFVNLYPDLSPLLGFLKRLLLQFGWLHYSLQGYLRTIGAHSFLGKIAWVILLILVIPSVKKVKESVLVIQMFLFYALTHFGYYALYIPSIRYLYPALIISFIGIAAILGHNASCIRKKTALIGIILPFLMVGLVLDSLYAWKEGRAGVETHSMHYTMYHKAVAWMKKNIPKNATIGAFNPGIYGYYSGRRVVNLDGYINNDSYAAIRDKRLFDYMKSQDVGYFIDWNQDYIKEEFAKYGVVKDFDRHFILLDEIEQDWGPYKGKKIEIYKMVY